VPAHIITLLSDFGLADYYVAAMKGVLLQRLPDARLVDITHLIPPQDIMAGSFALERAVASFPTGTVHLAVVDPGVGSDRRILVGDIKGQWIVCPDNGLITWTWMRHGGGKTYEVTWEAPSASRTFQGRDVMAPVAASLAHLPMPGEVARPIDDPIMLPIQSVCRNAHTARIIYIDHFGNAWTNLPAENMRETMKQVEVKGNPLQVRTTYGDVPEGQPLAVINSADLLEIAVRNGSAKKQFGLEIGDEVILF
jgi:S-adenosylmethionine hydrolase